jgi:hypothetical protein
MEIIGSGIRVSEVGCITAIKLYKSIVLPRCLYGTELLYNISKPDVTKLQVAHRFSLKHIQSFPKRTSSVIVERMANVLDIDSYIETKKLLFFGRLCRLNCNRLAKTIFIERIYQHKNQTVDSRGPVYDMCKVLNKYGLIESLDTFIKYASFPDKCTWKKLVNAKVYLAQTAAYDSKIAQKPELSRFASICGNGPHVHPLWVAEQICKGHRKHFRDLAKLNCVPYGSASVQTCIYCDQSVDDQLDHYIHHCIKYESTRELYWAVVINSFSVQLSSYLYNLNEREITAIILGKKPSLDATVDDFPALLGLGAEIWQILAYEKELRFYHC